MATKPAPLPSGWAELMRGGSTRQSQVRFTDQSTLIHTDKSAERIDELHKRFQRALEAAREAKMQADESATNPSANCRSELVRRLKELESINEEVQQVMREEEAGQAPKSLITKTSMKCTKMFQEEPIQCDHRLAHKAITAELKVRIQNLEEVLDEETRFRSSTKLDSLRGHPLNKTDGMGDETLCLMRHDVEALKIELMRLQKQKEQSSAQVSETGTEFNYSVGLDRLRERIGKLEKPLRKNPSFRQESTLSRSTAMIVQQLQEIQEDGFIATANENSVNEANKSKSEGQGQSRLANISHIDVADEVLKHPDAKRSLKELQRLSINQSQSKKNNDNDFDGMMLWVKRGKLVRRWRQRFVSIVEHRFFGQVLCLFKYEQGAIDGSKSRLVVLKNSRCTKEGQVKYQGEICYIFRLRTSKKEYWFATPEQRKQEQWIERLHQQTRR